MPKIKRSDQGRFFDLVDPIGGGGVPAHPEWGQCWLWLGARTEAGGSFEVSDGRRVLAHRFAYGLFHREFRNQHLQQFCSTDACTNPSHYSHTAPLTRRTKEQMREAQEREWEEQIREREAQEPREDVAAPNSEEMFAWARRKIDSNPRLRAQAEQYGLRKRENP